MQPKKRNKKVFIRSSFLCNHIPGGKESHLLFFFVYFIVVMRLGKKKEKDRDQEKEQFVDGVARLICSPNSKQSHPIPLRGN